MEKLIELLNEYEKEVKKSEIVWSIDNDGDICRQTYEGVDYNEYIEYMNTNNLISKSFGFIKRLVEQNKIDDSKVGNSDMLSVQYHDLVNDYKYEGLIMILSISENPISDLISYLK